MLFVWRNSFLTVLVGFCFPVACMGGMGKWSHTPNLAVGTLMKNFRKCLQWFFLQLWLGTMFNLSWRRNWGIQPCQNYLYAHRLMFRKCISSGVCILVAYCFFCVCFVSRFMVMIHKCGVKECLHEKIYWFPFCCHFAWCLRRLVPTLTLHARHWGHGPQSREAQRVEGSCHLTSHLDVFLGLV